GRCRCRWCVPQECSIRWAWLLAEVEVVVVAVVVVDGVGFVGVRGCRRGGGQGVGLSRVLLAPPCLASPVRLRRGVFRHCIGAGCWVAGVLPACGRGCCRCRRSYGCSMSWAWLLAEVWVVLVAAAVADGVCFVGVR